MEPSRAMPAGARIDQVKHRAEIRFTAIAGVRGDGGYVHALDAGHAPYQEASGRRETELPRMIALKTRGPGLPSSGSVATAVRPSMTPCTTSCR